jgi:hypothetical protein
MSFYPRYKTVVDNGGAFFTAFSGGLLVGIASATMPQSVYGGFEVLIDGFTHQNYIDSAWEPMMRTTIDWASKTMGANKVVCKVATIDTEKKELLCGLFGFSVDEMVELEHLAMDDYASCPAQAMTELRVEIDCAQPPLPPQPVEFD